MPGGADGLIAQRGSGGGGGPPSEPPTDLNSVSPVFAHCDHLGSLRLLSNESGATVGGSDFSFTPFGELLNGDSNLTNYKFTGQYADADIGLQYHRARWLNPTTANWLSQDSVYDFPDNFGNSYAYVGMNPVNYYDPVGMMTLAGAANVSSIVGTLTNISIPSAISTLSIAGIYLVGNEIINRSTLLLHIKDKNLQKMTYYNFPSGALTVANKNRRVYWLPINPLDYKFILGIIVHIVPRTGNIILGYNYTKIANAFANDMNKKFGIDLPENLRSASHLPTVLLSAPKQSPAARFFGGGISVRRNVSPFFFWMDSSVYSTEQVVKSEYKNIGAFGIGGIINWIYQFSKRI